MLVEAVRGGIVESVHRVSLAVVDADGRLVARADDTPDAIRARLTDYHQKTKPILDLFRKKELVVVVDGTPAAGDVQVKLRARLGLET